MTEGQSLFIPPDGGAPTQGMRHKVGASQLGGRVAILEGTVQPGEFIPPHTHSREDEVSCVIRGEVTFRVGVDTFTARAGSYVVKPREIVHAFWNASSEPAVIVEVISPGAFEEFFDAFGELPEGPERMAAMVALQRRFGMSIDTDLAGALAREHGLQLPFSPEAR